MRYKRTVHYLCAKTVEMLENIRLARATASKMLSQKKGESMILRIDLPLQGNYEVALTSGFEYRVATFYRNDGKVCFPCPFCRYKNEHELSPGTILPNYHRERFCDRCGAVLLVSEERGHGNHHLLLEKRSTSTFKKT